jgi:peptide/nickel transport system substrate-binding protein
MNPWLIVDGKRGNDQLWRYKRNPYYFKVDNLGNQLPYAEEIDFHLVDSLEDKMLRAMSGEADFVFPFSLRDKPTLYDQRDHGGYKLIEVVRDSGPHLVIGFNRTGPDKELSELAANKQFRIAASIALNRDEMSKALCNGLCQPLQAAPVKGTPFYDEAFATEYTEYDPAKANAILDQLGLDRRNSENIRLLKSGEPLAFTLVYYPRDDEVADELEFVQRFWREVGIKVILRAVDETSFEELMSSGAYNISAMTGPNTLYTYNPWAMVPCDLKGSIYASGWYGYVRNKLENTNGPFVEPDDATKAAIDQYLRMTATVNEAEKAEYIKQIIANAKEQFYLIGTLSDPGQAGVVSKNMMNIPDSIVLSWQRGAPANLQPAQWWKR